MIDTIIYLVAIIGIIAVVGSFFEIFRNSNMDYFKNTCNRVFDFSKNENKDGEWIKIDIYLNNIKEEKLNEIIEEIKTNKSINDLADYINVYKTFDNK